MFMQYNFFKHAKAMAIAICLTAGALSGCAGGEIEEVPGGDATDDARTMGDAGVDGETRTDGGDTDEDTVSPPSDPVPAVAPSGGGATLETSNHRIRLIVAPRGGAQTLETSNHRIRLGAGQVQHGQER